MGWWGCQGQTQAQCGMAFSTIPPPRGPRAPLPLLSLHLGLTHFSLTTQHLWPFRRVLCMTTDARGYSCPPS